MAGQFNIPGWNPNTFISSIPNSVQGPVGQLNVPGWDPAAFTSTIPNNVQGPIGKFDVQGWDVQTGRPVPSTAKTVMRSPAPYAYNKYDLLRLNSPSSLLRGQGFVMNNPGNQFAILEDFAAINENPYSSLSSRFKPPVVYQGDKLPVIVKSTEPQVVIEKEPVVVEKKQVKPTKSKPYSYNKYELSKLNKPSGLARGQSFIMNDPGRPFIIADEFASVNTNPNASLGRGFKPPAVVEGVNLPDVIREEKVVKQKGPNLSQRAEQINKAIEDWQSAKSKQTIEGIKKGAKATGKAVKGGVNYMKPIVQLGGKALGVGADIANAGQLITSDDPFDKWVAGVGLAGSALQKASIPMAASVVGAPFAPWAAGIGTALQYGGAAAPYVKDWVEGYQQQRDFEDNLSEQELMDLAKQRGLL